jgi:chromosome segregation ATPase
MQQAVAELQVVHDAARNEVNQKQLQHDTMQAELETALKRVRELTDSVARLQSAVEQAKAETRQLLEQIDTEERARKEAEERISQARGRLHELQEQARVSGREEIESRIREVYALLPQDEADRACRL